jgi:hypothetical protein
VCPRVRPEQCAQTTIRNSFLLPALSAEGGGFEREPPSRLHCRALPRNCLSHVYLKVRGEVAEWLKAMVC